MLTNRLLSKRRFLFALVFATSLVVASHSTASRVMASSPDNDTRQTVSTANTLGMSYLVNGDNAEALIFFEEALKVDPNNAVIRNNMGCALYRLQKYDLAKQVFLRVVKLDPGFTKAWFNLAETQFRLGDFWGAFQTYRIVKQIDRQYVANKLSDPGFKDRVQNYLNTLSDSDPLKKKLLNQISSSGNLKI